MSGGRVATAGVTLIEMLVSLAIFAVIGVAGLAVLDTVARTAERTEGRLERLSDIDRAFLVLRRDFAQMSPAALSLSDGTLRLSRAGPDGPLLLTYDLEEGRMARRIDTVDQTLLSGVESARWRILGARNVWQDSWPPDPAGPAGRPRAIELALRIETPLQRDAAPITRLFTLPAGHDR